MKVFISLLIVSVLSTTVELSPIIYGMLEGSKLVDSVSASRCTSKISRERSTVSFSNFVSDAISLSHECGWKSAAKALKKFKSSPSLMEKAAADIHSFLLTISAHPSKSYKNDGVSIGKYLEYTFAATSPTVVKFKPDFSKVTELKDSAYPIAVFHGLGDCCCFPGMIEFTKYLGKEANTFSKCIEVGDGPSASWLMGFQNQVNTACTNIKKQAEYSNGVNIVGLSQGGLIARTLAESCNITVHNVITLGGPHMGVMSLPNCESGFYCNIFNDALDLGVYDPLVQNNFGPPGYFKDQYKYDEYLKSSGFLASASNERSVNVAFANGFKAINQLVLIEFTEDTVVDPKESEWFGYYNNNSEDLLNYNETIDYVNDVLGFKTLDQQNKIVFESIVGNHLQFTDEDIQRTVIPYLT